ncbi:SAM-dependent methyltransferase [bacterium (Candidatus Howlettbacteria) CG_4_10_14_0_8_um_filter_40_9]|nr:MAG: SAM-dependent methyltransferase [bacterium (Candidatus Howlettbacteria) CG_4_10_14_0_8_um_filter_40_9]
MQKSKLILDFLDEEQDYSDGKEMEEKMIKSLKSSNSQEAIKKMCEVDSSCPVLTNLSPDRENLLSWYPFNRNESLLEIGSGWGALTGLFCEKLGKVTAIELTKRRSEITALRNKERANLTVIAGNTSRVVLDEKFDYVTSVGILEYAGIYTKSANPYLDFLKELKGFLKDNGTIIIAIENKFGLKYWSGSAEDHNGDFFESIQNYPTERGVRTFGKKEMTDLLVSVGFDDINFYYPLPDYRFPVEIFSDEYLPTINHNIRAGISSLSDFQRKKINLFDNRLASDNIIMNENFDFFANSFLIFAKEKK